MRREWAIANLFEEGVMELVCLVCTPHLTPNSRARYEADMYYGQGIHLVGRDDHDETHIRFDREEDVEPTLALLAEAGVYLTPYFPYVGDGWV